MRRVFLLALAALPALSACGGTTTTTVVTHVVTPVTTTATSTPTSTATPITTTSNTTTSAAVFFQGAVGSPAQRPSSLQLTGDGTLSVGGVQWTNVGRINRGRERQCLLSRLQSGLRRCADALGAGLDPSLRPPRLLGPRVLLGRDANAQLGSAARQDVPTALLEPLLGGLLRRRSGERRPEAGADQFDLIHRPFVGNPGERRVEHELVPWCPGQVAMSRSASSGAGPRRTCAG